MRKIVLAAGIAMLVVAGCSKPTELASEANAKYDRRDPVVAPPAVGEEVDTTPVEPIPGSEEALPPDELQPAPADGTPVDGAEGVPTETVDPTLPPTGTETLQPPTEASPPVDAAPPVESVIPQPAAPAPTVPPAETPPAPAPN